MEAVQPNLSNMVALDPNFKHIRSVILTVKGQEPYDFFSRYFAPWVGINEDPVTGYI